ncbi:MAG TPA: hypothetical protein VF772_02080 [Terriglobales bacterium]
MNSVSIYDKIRSLCNDEPGFILTDERLRPFILQAQTAVPYIASALFAMSRGQFEFADRMFLLCGVEFRSLREKIESESRKTENSTPEQDDAASGSQAATTTETHGSSEAG